MVYFGEGGCGDSWCDVMICHVKCGNSLAGTCLQNHARTQSLCNWSIAEAFSSKLLSASVWPELLGVYQASPAPHFANHGLEGFLFRMVLITSGSPRRFRLQDALRAEEANKKSRPVMH